MSESAEVEVKLDDGGSSIKLPINVMVLFFHLHISHSTDRCNLSSCNVTICSPRCNHRSTAPCRISAMEFCPKDTHNSHASPIFCSLTQRTDVGVTGSSVFDYDAETDCRFTFDLRSDLNSEDIGVVDGIFQLFSIIHRGTVINQGETLENGPNCDTVLRQSFEDAVCLFVQKEPHHYVVKLLQATLQEFANIFGGLATLEDWQRLDAAASGGHNSANTTTALPACISESSDLFQIAWKFQQVCRLRVSFMEGNHRHTKYSSLLFKMLLQLEFNNDEINDACFFIRQARDGGVEDSISDIMHSKVQLNYMTHVATSPSIIEDDKVIIVANRLSQQSQKQVGASVGNEYTHLYVFSFILYFCLCSFSADHNYFSFIIYYY